MYHAQDPLLNLLELQERRWWRWRRWKRWSDEASGILQGNSTNENVNFVYFYFGVLCSSLYSGNGRQQCTWLRSFFTYTCTVGKDWKKQAKQRFFDWVMTFLLKAMSWPTPMRLLFDKPVSVTTSSVTIEKLVCRRFVDGLQTVCRHFTDIAVETILRCT